MHACFLLYADSHSLRLFDQTIFVGFIKLCILTYYYKEIHITSQEFESTYESTGIFVIRGGNMGGRGADICSVKNKI